MLNSLTIKGFRCFREFHVEPLARVNLFVGKNNSGKTSLLEAAELLAIGGVEGLVRSAVRRDERVLPKPEPGEEFFREHTIDPAHLFFGHRFRVGSSFRICGSLQKRAYTSYDFAFRRRASAASVDGGSEPTGQLPGG
jgi:hypothetical protein